MMKIFQILMGHEWSLHAKSIHKYRLENDLLNRHKNEFKM